jgi:prepilin-type N-terminal cleavage/methylation domain-containing protein
MQRKHYRGFTIIELMVSLLVFAVLVALAAPSFRDLMIKSRLRGATDDIVNMLNTARTNAVKQERNISVALGGTTAAWCAGANSAADPSNPGEAVPAATKCDCTAANACKVGGYPTVISSSSYADVSVSDVTAEFVFDSKLGTLVTSLDPGSTFSATSINVSSGKFATTVTVSPLGQTHVCVPASKPFVSGYPSC